ncbi:MAG: deoxyribonuclease IV [Eubacteriales bacterium]|nr:deoxyribonuclease IV [Eubacteriales bacterium]MDD4461534.1 deoxyribonuclease IV [Eubacteriales bacterium]
MLNIGCHLSVSRGYANMAREALDIGANTFQFFSRNPRGSKAKAIDPADMSALCALLDEHGFAPVLAHAPYTMNPCSADPQLRQLAADLMRDDLERIRPIPGVLYNFHPGSHVGQGIDTGVNLIAQMLDQVQQPDHPVTILLEGMSGRGSEVGGRFEELRMIIDRAQLGERLGVCLDTCHLYAAGYDVAENLEGVLADFDRIVGLPRLKAIHLNDSMTQLGSHKDRHARIGEGEIGLEALVRLITHPALRRLPFYLETPNENDGYAREIRLLQEAVSQRSGSDGEIT